MLAVNLGEMILTQTTAPDYAPTGQSPLRIEGR